VRIFSSFGVIGSRPSEDSSKESLDVVSSDVLSPFEADELI
jgi:hypothetical protein